jgi:hypothetical protein
MTTIVIRTCVYITLVLLSVSVALKTYIEGGPIPMGIVLCLIAFWSFNCAVKDMKEFFERKKAKQFGDDAYGLVISSRKIIDRDGTEGVTYKIKYLMLYVNTITIVEEEVSGLEAKRYGKVGDFLWLKFYKGKRYLIDGIKSEARLPTGAKDKLYDAARNYV